MTEERAAESGEPPIVFTMPSLRDDGDVPSFDASTAVAGASDLDDLIARVTATVDGSADSVAVAAEETVAEVQPASPFAPPTPDTRAEYMYALVEIERQRILDATEPKSGLIKRLRDREK